MLFAVTMHKDARARVLARARSEVPMPTERCAHARAAWPVRAARPRVARPDRSEGTTRRTRDVFQTGWISFRSMG